LKKRLFIWKLATLTFCSFENLSTKVSQAKKKIIKSCFFRFKTAAPSAYMYISVKKMGNKKVVNVFYLFTHIAGMYINVRVCWKYLFQGVYIVYIKHYFSVQYKSGQISTSFELFLQIIKKESYESSFWKTLFWSFSKEL